ncbi:MAG: hypothetical protein HKP09_08775 [Enterobacterales bacterium]|nr:hypothetical protein [Enterobacterales bacterium]
MKFTFGPVHPISIILYVIGIPLLFLTIADHVGSYFDLSDALRLQLFLAGSICLVSASILNLGLHIYRQWRSNNESSP